MTLDEIIEDWEKDCIIDTVDVDISALEIPKLHAKYLKLYKNSVQQTHKIEKHLKKLQHKKTLYYSGRMTKEEMDTNQWDYDPFKGGSKPLAKDVPKWVGTDNDILKVEQLLENENVKKEILREILDNIKWRNQTIKSIIDYRKFQSGLG